jgi:Domain of unknown function (DUF1877)
MSMMGRFVSISPDRLQQIIDDPSGVEELFASEQVARAMPNFMGPKMQERLRALSPEMLGKALESMPPAVRDRLAQSLKNIGLDPDALARGEGTDALAKLMAQRLQSLGLRMAGQTPPPASGAGTQSSGRAADLSIDKAWHGLHYLLCGQVGPGSSLASQAVMGGTEVGDDLGYGPARYFEAARVADIARELTRPNLEAEMDARFDPSQMEKLGIYPGQFVSTEDKEWLFDAFRKLRQFYVDASAAKLAVVTCLE